MYAVVTANIRITKLQNIDKMKKEKQTYENNAAMPYDTVLPAVELTSRWHEILGNKREEMPDKLRRERWEQWKQLAIDDGGKDSVDYWMDTTACENCKHIDKDWCKLMELPCTVNPILTFSQGMIGMACMGAGKDVEPTQLALW